MITISVSKKVIIIITCGMLKPNHMLFLSFIQSRNLSKLQNLNIKRRLQSYFPPFLVNLIIQAMQYAQLQIMQGETYFWFLTVVKSHIVQISS